MEASSSSSPTSYRPQSPQLPALYAPASTTASRQPYIPPQSSSHYNPYRSTSSSYSAEVPITAAATYQQPLPSYVPHRQQYYAAPISGAPPISSLLTSNLPTTRHDAFWDGRVEVDQQLHEAHLLRSQTEGEGVTSEMRTRTRVEEPEEDPEYLPDAPTVRTPAHRRGRKPRAAGGGGGNGGAASGASAGGSSGAEGVEVKTKFPVARIKRIMQADEDVGKVAQVTPVVVSKALELFMIALITKSSSEARQRSSKRITSVHIKQAILKDEQFDFLQEIVNNIADVPVKEAADGGEEGEESSVGGGRKRRSTAGGGRRKRKENDDL